ncbi:MAG: dihydrofolate reductase, partial [Bacteroidales bacterium]|nr:dihydrofolate reductase [Bacteroidales bacterium]
EMVVGEENFIIGGGSVYRQFLPVADRLYLTVVNRDYEADTFFPEIKTGEWKEVFREEHPSKDPEHPGFTFYILKRNGDAKAINRLSNAWP